MRSHNFSACINTHTFIVLSWEEPDEKHQFITTIRSSSMFIRQHMQEAQVAMSTDDKSKLWV